MSETIDTNVLLYASDTGSPRRAASLALIERLAAGPGLCYLFWPVIMGYLRVATHPSIFAHPMQPDQARANIDGLLASPHVRTPGEGEGFLKAFDDVAEGSVVRGNLVPDAHIAALMRQYGVSRIWTADRDFRRFSGITASDPFRTRPTRN